MLILRILSLDSAHGYGIAQRLQQISRDTVRVNQGSLYPALHRLEEKGWLKAEWWRRKLDEQPSSIRSRRVGSSLPSKSRVGIASQTLSD
jgi:hypothetical protein